MKQDKTEMPFWDHLEELRWCLIKSILAIFIGAVITYNYADVIMHWLIIPTESLSIDMNLQVLKVTSMFTVKLSIALFGGIFMGLPVIMYQFWRFISPAFEKKTWGCCIYHHLIFHTVLCIGYEFCIFYNCSIQPVIFHFINH